MCFSLHKSINWKSLSKEEEFLPNTNFIMQGKLIMMNHFNSGMEGDYTDVDIIFGVKSLDLSKVKWWDPNGIGKPVWDKNFDIANPKSQLALLKLTQAI
jgi:hypothetical protein